MPPPGVTLEAVGVTATRSGLTRGQLAAARGLLAIWAEQGATKLHHGDCVGGDVQVAEMARELGYWIVCHPPDNERLRANGPADETRSPLPYLVRNERLVDTVSVLLGLPVGDVEMRRSGTWATVRYARKVGRPLVVVGPNGRELERRP